MAITTMQGGPEDTGKEAPDQPEERPDSDKILNKDGQRIEIISKALNYKIPLVLYPADKKIDENPWKWIETRVFENDLNKPLKPKELKNNLEKLPKPKEDDRFQGREDAVYPPEVNPEINKNLMKDAPDKDEYYINGEKRGWVKSPLTYRNIIVDDRNNDFGIPKK